MTKRIAISKLKLNPDNPRFFGVEHIKKAVDSLLSFPKMMSIRPMVHKSYKVQGGNVRLTAINKIKDLTLIELTDRLQEIKSLDPKMSTAHYKSCLKIWEEILQKKTIPGDWVRDINSFTPYEKQKFVILDNVPFGEWDLDKLRSGVWESLPLQTWGLSIFDQEQQEEEQEKYTKKIKAPTYEPSTTKPPIQDLIDLERGKELRVKIENAKISEEEKEFLIRASYRHHVFNYELIADYYAHSSKEVQELMEDSALVIIDFDKAIEKGYVQLNEAIMSSYLEEH